MPHAARIAPTRNWESTLQSWIKPASSTEEDRLKRTESEIRAAIRASNLPNNLIRVYGKGSVPNNTNVRHDSDIDVAVEWTAMLFSDLTGDLEGATKSSVGLHDATSDPYNLDVGAFKNHVENALVAAFGRSAVSRGNKAIHVRESSRSVAADVVPCFEYRRYYARSLLGARYHQGHVIFPDRGARVINWPQQHYDNGVSKNEQTRRRFKQMVRALKRLENELVEKGVIPDIPSYLIECLVYNVPDSLFGHTTLVANIRAVLMTIFNETLATGSASEWEEVNGLKWLFRGPKDWTLQDAHRLADAAWDYMGFE